VQATGRRTHAKPPVPEFIVGHANRVAHEAVRRAACEPDAPDLVFIHGPCGVGKTHLVRHAAAMARRARRDARIRVTSGELFISGYVNAIQNNTVAEFQKRHRKLDLLVIDDVHVIAGKEGTQQELVRTLNDLHLTGARVILASDAHPREIARMQAALSSRLVSGVVAPIARPDADLVRRLVPALAKRRGITLDPKGLEILVQRITEDTAATVRDIEGTLTQIQAMANLLDRDRGLFLSADHVRQAVEMRAGDRAGIRPGPVGIEKIIDTVCRELGVTRDDLGGKGRAKKVVLARELIVHLGKRHTGRSYPELAMAIGRPNHSTVITAHQRFQERLKTESPIAVNAAFDGTTAGELTTRMERAMGV
jgi:chromosomal replication initiator protein